MSVVQNINLKCTREKLFLRLPLSLSTLKIIVKKRTPLKIRRKFKFIYIYRFIFLPQMFCYFY